MGNSNGSPDSPKSVSPIRAHLDEVWHWSTESEIEAAEIAAGAIGMATPVMLGAMFGNLAAGAVAAAGCLAVGRLDASAPFRTHLWRELETVSPVIVAALVIVLCAGHGLVTMASLLIMIGIAAALGSFSVSVAADTTRFITFVLIVGAAAASNPAISLQHPLMLLGLVAGGVLWTSVVSLTLGALLRWHRGSTSTDYVEQSGPTLQQRWQHWRNSMTKGWSWNYTIRMTGCVAVAMAINFIWPGYHMHWVGITVAIVTQRRVEAFPARTTQRAVGTAFGVLLAGVMLHADLPHWALVSGIAVLAGARTLLRSRNYLLYSLVMTPLVIMIIDGGHVPASALLLERLGATLIGVGLVLVSNLVALQFAPKK